MFTFARARQRAVVAVLAALSGCGTGANNHSGAATCAATVDDRPVVLATGAQGAQAIAVDATNVYWGRTPDTSSQGPSPAEGAVLQCAKCGCDHPTVLASNEPNIGGLAVDATSVYWTNGDVMKVPIGGGEAIALVVAQTAGPIAVDATSVYWADVRGLMKAAITGGSPTMLVSMVGVGFVALDAANVYFTAGSAIFKVPLDGGAPPTSLAMASNTVGFAVDATNVYWLEFGAALKKVPIGGGAATTLAIGLTNPGFYALALDSTSVYFTGDMAVNAIPIGGGAPMTLFASDSSAAPFGVAVDATSVYWTNFLTGAGPVVMKLALNK